MATQPAKAELPLGARSGVGEGSERSMIDEGNMRMMKERE